MTIEHGSGFCQGCGTAISARSNGGTKTLQQAPCGVSGPTTVDITEFSAAGTRKRQAMQLWGWTGSQRFIWISLAFTGIFVWFEAAYNIELLATLSNPNTSEAAIQDLSQRGTLLASLGITWAIARSLITRIQPPLFGLAAFLVVSIVVYHSLDTLYNRVIHNLSAEVKVDGYTLFNYRRDLLTNRLHDPDIPLPQSSPVEGKIIMGSFPIVLLDERYMLPARDVVEQKSNDKRAGVLTKSAESWPSYKRQSRNLNRQYNRFIDGSRKAIRWKSHGGIARFREQSGGFEPNPNLTRAEFLDMLRGANNSQGESLREAEAKVIFRKPDGTNLLAGEVPYFMNRDEYSDWFNSQAENARAETLPTVETVENFPKIHEVNSAVFLPPMAIITSLTSALTNLITLALMLLTMALVYAGNLGRFAAKFIGKYSPILMLAIFAGTMAAMPSHVFKVGTPMYQLETLMHDRVGLAGHTWSRLSNLQAVLLGASKS
jgi:hypothetical protein